MTINEQLRQWEDERAVEIMVGTMSKIENVPHDYKNPNFKLEPFVKHIHEWKTYVSCELESAWGTFSDEQKKVIAKTLQDIADDEQWD
jgi:L-ribulose-5-phosphate 3-epimerase UlaE